MEVEMEEDEMGLNGKSAFAALPLRSPTSLSIYLDTEEGERERKEPVAFPVSQWSG